MQQCTFRPAINSRSEFFARRSRACCPEPLAERLHHEADKKLTLRQKAKQLLEADELYSHSFHPQINKPPQRATGSRTPIHLRAEEIRLKKEEHHRALRSAEDARSQCSFKPQISEQSARIVQRKREKLHKSLGGETSAPSELLQPVEERLYAGALASQERREAQQDSLCEPAQTPNVDETSRRICKTSVYFQGAQQDFLTRQQTFELARRRRAEMRAQHAENECSFAPRISDHSRQLASMKVDLVGETVEEKVNRLAVKDSERRERLQAALEKLQYRDCTFKPTLNPTSEALASACRGRDIVEGEIVPEAVHDRLYKSSLVGRSRTCEETFMQDSECSFRPQLDQRSVKRYAHVKPHYSCDGLSLMDNIKEDIERREDRLAELRIEMEEEQQAECTFAPETAQTYEEPQRPVPVSGLGRFFELRELAQRQQQERGEREKRVFRPDAGSSGRLDGVTIPEPFELSRGPLKERAAARQPEWAFAPKTTEAANRALLQQMLQGAYSKENAAEATYYN